MFLFLTIFMVSMNGFVGGGITRDGLELVGERYGLYFFLLGSLSSTLCLDLLMVDLCEYVIILMCPHVPFLVVCFLNETVSGKISFIIFCN